MEFVQIYFDNLNKLAIKTFQFPCIFSAFIWKIFPPGSGSKRDNKCGSMQIRIHSPADKYSQHLLTCLEWSYHFCCLKNAVKFVSEAGFKPLRQEGSGSELLSARLFRTIFLLWWSGWAAVECSDLCPQLRDHYHQVLPHQTTGVSRGRTWECKQVMEPDQFP